MIAAYVSCAVVGSVVYLLLRRRTCKARITISATVFLVLCAIISVWFINTGGTYGIMGKNGITPDWSRQ
ncbi:formate hydrogenlyase subunit 3/multisubunit Na+/H+ antiporter MnhD subunit [Ochrobactrum sp. 19YEA23]|nr:formate hydrogenlyase subunit 3/multisubunit Na+/H+ antiporter MnhD subunit [Ochrobactrum sp. 19YEA23]